MKSEDFVCYLCLFDDPPVTRKTLADRLPLTIVNGHMVCTEHAELAVTGDFSAILQRIRTAM